jgi:hypothetical protein
MDNVALRLIRWSAGLLVLGLPTGRASGGDSGAAVDMCLAEGVAGNMMTLVEDPPEGQARFYLVRARDGSGASTYDDASPGLAGPRDGSIRSAQPVNRCAE